MAKIAPAGPTLANVVSYSGQRLFPLQPFASRTADHTVCYPSLSGLQITQLPTESGNSSLHWIPDDCDDHRSITAVALSPQGNLLAVADRRMGVRVSVYEWPSRRNVHVVKDVATLQIADMCWHRSGQAFAVLSGDPKHNLTVFSVDAKGGFKSTASQDDASNDHQFDRVSFSPRSASELCTSGGGHIAFWKVEEHETTTHRRSRLVQNAGRVSVPGVRLTAHTWLQNGGVLAGTQSGALMLFDTSSGIGDPTDISASAAIVGLITTKHCVVACSSAGEVLFISHDGLRLVRTEVCQLPGTVTSMAFVGLDSFVLGSDAGFMQAVVVPGMNTSAAALAPEELELLAPKQVPCEEGFGQTCAAVLLPDHDSLAGLSDDGILRVRSLKGNKVLVRAHVGAQPDAMMLVKPEMAMILFKTGSLRFVDLKAGAIVQQLGIFTPADRSGSGPCRLYSPLTNGVSTGRHVLAIVDARIFIIDTQLRVPVAEVALPSVFQSVLDVTFIATQPGHCVMSTGNASVVLLKLPTELPGASPGDVELPQIDFEELQVNRWRCELPFARISVLSFYDGVGFNLMGASIDRDVKFSTVDLSLAPKRKDVDTKALKLPLAFKDHSKACTFIATMEGKLLVTAGTDGRIVVRNVSALAPQGANPSSSRKDDPAYVVCRHSSFDGGVKCLTMCGPWITTVGGDGGVAVWDANAMCKFESLSAKPRFHVSGNVPAFATVAPVYPPLEAPADEEHFFLEKRKLEADQEDHARYEAYRKEVVARVAVLRDRLREVRSENERAEADEKLEPEDFLVQRDQGRFQSRVDEAIEAMRDDVKWHDLRADYVSHTLKRQCWDSMANKLTPLYGMARNELCVYSCHERTVPTQKLSILRKLKFLRRIEETERAARKVCELESLTEGAEGAAEAVDNADAEAAEGGQPSGEPSPLLRLHTDIEGRLPPPEAEANEDITPYLYRPVLSFSRHRAIIQIMLLESQWTNIVRSFNAKCTELTATKRAETDKIKERNVRSSVIQKELGDDTPLFDVQKHADENPASLLEVPDHEIPADKSHDPEEKRRVAIEEAERERWRRQHGNDDSSERALKMWMDGRLDKEIKALKVDVQEPEFAVEGNAKFVPLDERSDDQLRIYREYEKKLKQRTEEVAQRRKQLQAEFAQLQKDNKDAAGTFDASLEQLLLERLIASQMCAKVDLYRVKLAQSIAMQHDRDVVLAKLERQREVTAERAVQATASMDRFKAQLDKKEAELVERVAEEKGAEKNMRSMPPFNDHEESAERLAKIYANAKKKAAAAAGGRGRAGKEKEGRAKKEKGAQAAQAEAAAKIAANPDPFAFIDAEAEAKAKALQEEAAAAGAPFARLEKPEGMSEGLWDSFIHYVQDRVHGERDIKRLKTEVEEMRAEYQRLAELCNELRTIAHERAGDLVRFREDALHEMYDTDDLRMYRQGQVEVPQPPVATDYADAVLVHSRDIIKLNEAIRERGHSKVHCMEEMMGKRSDLRYVEWELEKYQYQCQTLELECRHLHTLRVTKQMQEFIHGGGEGYNERERAKLHAKIDHVRSTMSAKIEEKKQQMSKVKRATKERELENTLLLEQVSAAESVVDSRRSVRDLQSSELERERHNRLMRDMRVTRKLEDVAKAQQEEMGSLRKEIDRLRERTFPSFAVVSKRVIGNPDEA